MVRNPITVNSVFFTCVKHATSRHWFVGVRRARSGNPAFLYALITQALTGSDLVHCAFGHDGYVVDVGVFGTRIWLMDDYVLRPGVSWAFLVPSSGEPRWHHHENDTRRRSWWPSVLSLVTFGLFRASDCVTETCDLLRSCGTDVPRGTNTPQKLWDHLERQGYGLEALGWRAARQAGGPAP